MVQSCAEKQQLHEAMQLLHSVACQISEHQNVPLQPLQPSQLRHRSQQPIQGLPTRCLLAMLAGCPLINQALSACSPATPLPQSQPGRQTEQPLYAAGSAQQAGCQDASQWQAALSLQQAAEILAVACDEHLTPSTQAAVCREQSSPLQLLPEEPCPD